MLIQGGRGWAEKTNRPEENNMEKKNPRCGLCPVCWGQNETTNLLGTTKRKEGFGPGRECQKTLDNQEKTQKNKMGIKKKKGSMGKQGDREKISLNKKSKKQNLKKRSP